MTSHDNELRDAHAVSRRTLLLGGAASAAMAATQPGAVLAGVPDGEARSRYKADAIRPFRVQVPDSALADLRRRIAATRWPDPETVPDRSQGVQLAKLQALTRYWGDRYDWRKAERKLNAFPQFVTRIEDVDIHFLHIKSRHADALPMVMTHGWPGSVFELLNVVGPLTDPTAHGGRTGDAFHLVLPSLPGFGFSDKPRGTGWNPDRIARAWDVLMKRLGYERYVSQGGDWGAIVSDALARQAPPGLLAIHVNRVERATTVPPEVAKALTNNEPPPAALTVEERAVFDELRDFFKNGLGYAAIHGTRPQTMGYGLSDSPVALAAWVYDKIGDWVFHRGDPERSVPRDEILDDITLYWLTNTGPSSGRIYWEAAAGPRPAPVSLPAAVSVFPGEVYKPPKAWAQRAYTNLVHYNRLEKGGHFAAWEEPLLFSEEVRAAFRTVR